MLASIMKDEFGLALITGATTTEVETSLPSPEELKYKILFKVSFAF
jgi:hypothetical protein